MSDPDATDDTDTETTVESGDTAESEDETQQPALTIRARDLKLGVWVLGAFLLYSVWVAYATTAIWAFAAAASVATGFLLTAWLYVSGRQGSGRDGTAERPASGSATDVERLYTDDAVNEGRALTLFDGHATTRDRDPVAAPGERDDQTGPTRNHDGDATVDEDHATSEGTGDD